MQIYGLMVHVRSLGAVAALLLFCQMCGMASGVNLYASPLLGVLDSKWDDSALFLHAQLIDSGLEVELSTTGQADLASIAPGDAYIVPAQNGPTFYANAEDMSAVASFVKEGGLVIMLDANHGEGEAQKQFVAQALGYEGTWATACKAVDRTKHNGDRPTVVDASAQSFLPAAAWPPALEDAHVTKVHTRCRHTDPRAVSWPLYTLPGNSGSGSASPQTAAAVVAQAFGAVGARGAVVWLGYSWKGGLQAGWGSLLHTIITEFANGAYTAPLTRDDSTPASDRDHLTFTGETGDDLITATSDLADDAAEVVRRFLQSGAATGTYPSPQPPSPQPPSPSPSPSPSPAPRVLFSPFTGMLGSGVFGNGIVSNDATVPSIIWFDDPNFDDFRNARNHVNLIHRKARPCGGDSVPGTCSQCPRAWQADYTINVTILFNEPWQLDSISIKELQNPGVLKVELLPWPAVLIPGLPDLSPKDGTLAPPIWDVTVDTTVCGTTLTIPFGSRSGTNLPVPKRGSQTNIPKPLRKSVLGGVNIIVKVQPEGGKKPPGYTFIESVSFDGRALYPMDPAAYQQ